MRRRTDKVALASAAVCIVVAIVVVGVAYTVLDTSNRTDAATAASKAAVRSAKSAAASAASNRYLITQLTTESAVREQQFCVSILGPYRDKVRQITQTREYLRTRNGREHTGLNDYLRAKSFPRLVGEVAKERKTLPPICLHP